MLPITTNTFHSWYHVYFQEKILFWLNIILYSEEVDLSKTIKNGCTSFIKKPSDCERAKRVWRICLSLNSDSIFRDKGLDNFYFALSSYQEQLPEIAACFCSHWSCALNCWHINIEWKQSLLPTSGIIATSLQQLQAADHFWVIWGLKDCSYCQL